MVNYQQGKIYKIVCNMTGMVYVGSTCEQRLSQRLTKHVATYKQYLKGNHTYCSSYDIIEKGNYEIILLETCPCSNSEELRMRERVYKENINCINIYNPCKTKEDAREWNMNYRNENRDLINAINKKSRDNNKEKIALYHKQWREQNKETLKEAKRKYYYENIEQIKAHQKEYKYKRRLYLDQLKYYNI